MERQNTVERMEIAPKVRTGCICESRLTYSTRHNLSSYSGVDRSVICRCFPHLPSLLSHSRTSHVRSSDNAKAELWKTRSPEMRHRRPKQTIRTRRLMPAWSSEGASDITRPRVIMLWEASRARQGDMITVRLSPLQLRA